MKNKNAKISQVTSPKNINIVQLICLITVVFTLVFTGCKNEPDQTTNTNQAVDSNQNINSDVTAPIKYNMHFGIGGYLYPDIKYGADKVREATRSLDELGMIWLRHPGKGIAWYEIQPDRDTWNFAKLDAVIYGNDHPFLIPIYGMIGNPYPFGGNFNQEYLESLGGKNEIMDYIIEHEVDMDDPQQKADAEIYVKKLVSRYKDQIKYWEIGGNEGIVSPGRFNIVANTYTWVKEVHPEAKVLITAVGGDDDNQFYNGLEALDSLLDQGIADYFDIAHFHYYGVTEGDFEERLEIRYDDFKTILDKHGVSKPIWVTETSTSSESSTYISGESSEQRQAQDVVKRLTLYSAKGAEKVIWYNYGALSPGDKFYGCNLVEKDGIFKPAYYTFKMMVDKLGVYTDVETLENDDPWIYKFTTPTETVLVAWSKSDQTVNLTDYLDQTEVQVTSIIEEKDVLSPHVQKMPINKVKLTHSPVFIE